MAGVGDGVLPFKRSRLEPPMWFEWFDPGWLPALAGWDMLPRGRRKRWSSSSLPPNSARLSEGGGSMVLSPVSFLPTPVPRLVVINHWLRTKMPLFLFRVDILSSFGCVLSRRSSTGPPARHCLGFARRFPQMVPPSQRLFCARLIYFFPKLISIDRAHFDPVSDNLHVYSKKE